MTILNHTDLLNYLATTFNLQSYLEIGVRKPELNFDKIVCKNKTGIDPEMHARLEIKPLTLFKHTSDRFFEILLGNPLEPYDLIFIDGLHHALAMIARRIRIVARRRVAVFGGEHNTLPVVLNELSDEPFARPVRVHICGVNEVSSGFAICVVDLAGFVLRRAPAPFLTERHRAQRHFGHPETTFA